MNKYIFCLVFLIVQGALPVFADPGASDIRAGNTLYFKGNFPEAMERYKSAAVKAPADVRIDYDLGTAAYKTGQYRDALGFFNKALLSDNEKIVRAAHYNLGNTFYKAGIEKEDKDIGAAIKSLQECLGHYDKAITNNLEDQDVKSNREFAASELERLQKKQQEQQKQCQRPQSNDKQDQQKQSRQDQDRSQPQDDTQPSQAQEQKKDDGKETQEKKEQKEQEQQQKEQEKKIGGQQDEANMLLDDFAQNEQPKGLLNFNREAQQERPVMKDY